MDKKFLYIWEYGGNLGHLTTFLPVAKKLKALGWSGHFYIPVSAYGSGVCRSAILDSGFECSFNPYSRRRNRNNAPAYGHLDLLSRLDCLNDVDSARFHIQAWAEVIEQQSPDIVMGDFSPMATLVARLLGYPTVVFDTGYFYPDSAQELPLFNLDDLEPRRDKERRVLEICNQALKPAFDVELTDLREIYQCSKIFYCNFPSIAPFRHVNERDFVGAMVEPPAGGFLEKVEWQTQGIEKPKVIAYLHLSSEEGINILKTLCRKPELDVIVCAPHAPANLLDRSKYSHVQFFVEPIEIENILEKSNLVICHSGVGLISQALWRGKPLLLAPYQHEQRLNAERVHELSLGRSLHYCGYEPQAISAGIDELLFDEKFIVNARSFRGKNVALDVDEIAGSIELISSAATLKRNPKARVKECDAVNFGDLEVVFLSYDEPNADENWAKLRQMRADAIRVHGVEGLDAAHKEAASRVTGKRFILVDGDNQLYPKFFETKVNVPSHLHHSTWQWRSENSVNALVYAGGGVKIWNTHQLLNLRSHESLNVEDEGLALDFWDQPGYFVFREVFSDTVINASPLQCFRAGFREGVKYTVDNINAIKSQSVAASSSLLRRLAIWMSVGLDTRFGVWAMIGARHGFLYGYDNHQSKRAIRNVNDYAWIREIWHDLDSRYGESVPLTTDHHVIGADAERLRDELDYLKEKISPLFPLPVLNMSVEESMAFKEAMRMNRAQSNDVFDLLLSGGEV